MCLESDVNLRILESPSFNSDVVVRCDADKHQQQLLDQIRYKFTAAAQTELRRQNAVQHQTRQRTIYSSSGINASTWN